MTALEKPSADAHAYRVYFLDNAGKIVSATELTDIEDDEAAIKAAEAFRYAFARELWDRARMIRRFDPDLDS
jgi:hypothetical protein